MTDDQIQALIDEFMVARGGYVAGASERELFWVVKNAVEAERTATIERCAQVVQNLIVPRSGDRQQHIVAAIRRLLSEPRHTEPNPTQPDPVPPRPSQPDQG